MLPHSIQIGPFICEQCAVEFAPLDGGLCRVCRRMLCARHLTEDAEAAGGSPGSTWICAVCLEADRA